MSAALERQGGEVHRLGPLMPRFWRLIERVQRHVGRITGKTLFFTTYFSRKIARMAEVQLADGDFDVIFAPAGSGVIAHLKTKDPVVYLSDATFKGMLDYYPEFSNVLSSHKLAVNEIESLAIQNCAQLIYPSRWAANSAVTDYGAVPTKVHVVPFGANIETVPSREQVVRSFNAERCRLLFVGVEWLRKGGDIALETLLALERLGVPAELTVVGCLPPNGFKHPNLKVIPFINKNEPEGRERLQELWNEADFFLLPTRAECFSIALCEANAYGIPILSTLTGGVPELVRDGVNGYLFPLAARGEAYAEQICKVYRDPMAYQALRISSREEFESRLNWDAWGRSVMTIFLQAIQSPRGLKRNGDLQPDSLNIQPNNSTTITSRGVSGAQ